MKNYANLIAGRPQLYTVPADAVELTDEQVSWMLERPHITTLEEILAMQEALPPPPSLHELKVVKLGELNRWNAAAIAVGYTDDHGRCWGIADEDRRAWSELLSALKDVFEASPDYVIQSMREKGGSVIHTNITFAEFKIIMQGVAQTYMQIDKQYNDLRTLIISAHTAEMLDDISFPVI